MSFNPKDHYYKKAKKENFAARSVYKLEEIDQKFKLLKNGDSILDLGCAPGSWSQYASKKVGSKGAVLGIDLKEVNLKLENTHFVQKDIYMTDIFELATSYGMRMPFDLVISDMAPATTGVKFTDQARSHDLCERALDIADKYLAPKGHFICKLFHSDDFQTLKKNILAKFEKFEALKPQSTRTQSKEIFLIGIRKKT